MNMMRRLSGDQSDFTPTWNENGVNCRSPLPSTFASNLDSRYAMRLIEQHPRGVGYLLKERISDLAVLADALRRLREGECVIDPTIVSRLVHGPRPPGRLDELTPREVEVLAQMAEGRSNKGIADRLFLSPRTVETHVKQIFMKLGIDDSPEDHRRVHAVIAFLREPFDAAG
jgi:DNA-binding NarL/FixJ family response regulator